MYIRRLVLVYVDDELFTCCHPIHGGFKSSLCGIQIWWRSCGRNPGLAVLNLLLVLVPHNRRLLQFVQRGKNYNIEQKILLPLAGM